MNILITYLKNIGLKRLVVMVIGNVVMGLGVALFKLSSMGNDPFNGMNMAMAVVTGISYPVFQILVNIILLSIQFIFGRKYIGAGTLVNALLCGYIVAFFYKIFGITVGYEFSVGIRIVWVVVGVVICSLGLSLYQRSDAGIAPYDALAIIMDERISKLPYFWCRMICDVTCAVICFAAGGIVGLGTIVTALGLGPVIHFFDKNFTDKYIIKK